MVRPVSEGEVTPWRYARHGMHYLYSTLNSYCSITDDPHMPVIPFAYAEFPSFDSSPSRHTHRLTSISDAHTSCRCQTCGL